MKVVVSRPHSAFHHNLRIKQVLALFLVCSLASCLLAPSARAETPDEQFQYAANLYNQQKLYAEAAHAFQSFLNANPTHPQAKEAAYFLGAALYRAKNDKGDTDYAAAAAAYESALNKFPNSPHATAARRELGESYYNLKEYAKAVAPLQEVLKSNPKLADGSAALSLLGDSYYQLQQPGPARAAFQRLLDEYGTSDDAAFAQYSLGLIALDAKQYPAASAAFRAVVTKFANSDYATQARLSLADALLADKKYDEASKAYRDVLNDPKAADFKADAQLGMANALFSSTKSYPDAATAYEQVLANFKGEAAQRNFVQQRLGDSYYNAKDYGHAVTGYQPLVGSADAKTAGNALYFSGNALRELKRYREAEANYQKILDKYPTHLYAAKAALRLGDTYADDKNPAQAATAYKIAVTKYAGTDAAKEAQDALVALVGEVAGSKGNGDQTAAVAEILRSLPPGAASSNAQLQLASAAFGQQDWKKAAELAQAALDGNPDAATGENAYYLVGWAKLNGQDAPAAATAFRSQVTKYPQGKMVAEGCLGLAYALSDAKKYADAEAATRRGLASAPKPDIKERLELTLGEALIGGGKAKEATPVLAALESSANKEIASAAALDGAQALETAKDWPAAARSWAKYAELAPDAPTRARAYYHQGFALAQAKSGVAAIAAYDKAITADPKSDIAAHALSESAWTAVDLKQNEQAAARWKRLATEYPSSKYAGDASFQQGEAAFEAGKWDDAISAYRTVTGKFATSEVAPTAWYKLGSALYNVKHWPEAAAAFGKAASFPKSEFALESSFWAGESLRQAGKVSDARSRYQTFIKEAGTAPKEVQAYLPSARLGLGQALVEANDLAQGVATYQAALKDAKGSVAAELNYRLGEAMAKQNKWAEAAQYYLKVVTLYDKSQWKPQSLWGAGQALENSGAKAEAVNMYKQLAALQGNDLSAQARARLKALGVS